MENGRKQAHYGQAAGGLSLPLPGGVHYTRDSRGSDFRAALARCHARPGIGVGGAGSKVG